MIKCDHCKNPIAGKNFGRVFRGAVLDYCSPNCKAAAVAFVTGAVFQPPNAGDRSKKKNKPLTGAALRKKLRPKEGDISKSIGNDLDRRTIWNSRLQSGSLKSASGHFMKLCPTGTPDRIFADGLVVFIEVKKEGEIPTPEQLDTMRRLRENGALCFVVDSIDDYNFLLSELKKRRENFALVSRIVANYQDEIDAAIAARKNTK